MALVKFNSERAKDQMRNMYDYQDKYGMIADCIYCDTLIDEPNWRDTKPRFRAGPSGRYEIKQKTKPL